MKHILLSIISLTLFSGCRDKIEKFVFDGSKVSENTSYYYEFKSDKLISKTEKTFIHMFGRIVDSMITKTTYEYDKKKLLIRANTYYKQKPESEIYEYLSNDSLVNKTFISDEGDTTLWEKYAYFPDGRKTIFHKEITLHLAPDQDLKQAFEHKTYDTTTYWNEFEYADHFCKTIKQYDRNNILRKVVDFQYHNSKISKETYHSVVNNISVIGKTKYYYYSKSEKQPDSFALDPNNDTIESINRIFKNNDLVLETEINDYGIRTFKRFYEGGKKIGEIASGKNINHRIVDLYTYYPDGNKKQMLTYREKTNSH